MSKNVTSAAVDVFLGDYLYQRFFIADTVGHNASLLGPLLKAILRNQLAATVMRNDPLEPVAVKIYDAQDVDNLPSCFDPSADGPKVHEITW